MVQNRVVCKVKVVKSIHLAEFDILQINSPGKRLKGLYP